MSSNVAPDPASVAQETAAAQSAASVALDDPPASLPVEVTNAAQDGAHDEEHAAADSLAAHSLDVVQPAETGEFGLLEVDTDSDRDSAYNDDYESFTTSIKSSATKYKFEHGRRYHAYGEEKYPLPNDNDEINRLELQHRCWHLSLSGRLYLAPLPSNIKNALDIGCGTGSWVIDFAEQHPQTRVLGADLSPIQPTMVPPNVEFIVDDITKPWVYDQKFDYIHSRAITVGVRDWAKLVDEIWKHLEPGGWVEFQEYHLPFVSDDHTDENCPDFVTWNHGIYAAAEKAGTKLDAILAVPAVLAERGFLNAGTASTKWPLGPWARGKREKRIGDVFGRDISGNIEGVSMRLFTNFLGYTREEVSALAASAAQGINSGKIHSYMPVDFLWAQKPVDATD